MKTKLLTLISFFCFALVLAQELDNSWKLRPHIGLSQPAGDFSDFSSSGFNVGLSLDKYLSKRFALGLALDYSSLGSEFPSNFEQFLGESNLTQLDDGNSSIFTLGLGPNYTFGSDKLSVDVFSKAGLSFINIPNQSLTHTSFNIRLYEIAEQNITSFSLLSGIRFNYALSDKVSLHLNPYFLYAGQQAEVFSRTVNAETNIDMLDTDAGQLCFHNPNTWGVNGGISINLGGGSKDKEIPENSISNPLEDFEDLILKITSHPKLAKIKISDKKNTNLKWEVFGKGKKRVKYYRVEVYQLDPLNEGWKSKQMIKTEIVKNQSYVFKPSYQPKNSKSYYHFKVIGLDKNKLPITNKDDRVLYLSSQRPKECVEVLLDSIVLDCKYPAYDQDLMRINYRGKLYISVPSDCGSAGTPIDINLGSPNPNTTSWGQNFPGNSILNQFVLGNAFDSSSSHISNTDWNWSFTNSTPSYTVPVGSQIAVDIDLWFRNVPGSVEFFVGGSANTYNGLDWDFDSAFNDEIDACLCDPCEEFEIMQLQNVSITQDAQNHHHHSILNIDQTFQVGTMLLNTIKAEIVHFEEVLPDDYATSPELFELDNTQSFPTKHLCQICNAHIEGLGVFEGISTIDSPAINGNNLSSRSIKWYFNSPKNFSSGVNANLQIGIPKISPLDCCSKEYNFTIRYTFETEDCRKCELLVDYNYQTQ